MQWPKLWSSSPSTSTQDNSNSTESIKSQVEALKVKAEETATKLSSETKHAVAGLKSSLSDTNPASNGSLINSLLTPQTIISTTVLTTAILTIVALRRRFLRRYPIATSIPQAYILPSTRRFTRSVFGHVTSVGDADNFRLFHTPLGRLAFWGTPIRSVPADAKQLKNNTIHIRLAGIDAPEAAHFGKPAQPYSKEALDWLTTYLRGKRVRCYVHRQDQYSRVVATVYIRKGLLRRDVGLQMLKAGWATVYEAKSGAEFAGKEAEQRYRAAEESAKRKKRGMWKGGVEVVETPREYKNRHRDGDTG